MYNLTKKEKLEFVLKNQKELNISANSISKNTKLTEAGVQRILKGISKNPQEDSLNQIMEFFEKKITGTGLNKVEEHPPIYEKSDQDLKKLVQCLEKESKLRNEIQRLQRILRKNKIEFDDDFEE